MVLGALVLQAVCAAAAVLLIVAGIAKLRTPTPAATMITTFWPTRLHVRRARWLARLAGTVELGAGIATLADGGRIALLLLAGCYLILSAVALRLASGGRRAACGCFGEADGVVGRTHVVLDLAALAVASWAIVRPPGSVVGLFGHGALLGVTITAQALLLAALGYLTVTALPALSRARRAVEGTS